MLTVAVPRGEDAELECDLNEAVGPAKWSYKSTQDAESVDLTAAVESGSTNYKVKRVYIIPLITLV